MSRKVTSFRAVLPAPKTLSQYWVNIPFITNSLILVEAAAYPTEDVGEVAVWVKGQQIFFPTFSKVQGTWECVISEDVFATNQISIDALRNVQIGNGKYVIMFDILIALTYGETIVPIPNSVRTLRSAFLVNVAPVGLDASKPGEVLKWRLTFRYNLIKSMTKYPF